MTIGFTTLFTRAGKFISAGNSINTALATTVAGKVDTALQGLGSALTAEYELVREGVRGGLSSFQQSGNTGNATLIQTPVQNLTLLTVSDDNPIASTLDLAVRELIKQMEDNSESLDASSVGSSLSYGAGNAGDGILVASTKRADGKVAMFTFAETLEAVVTAVAADGTATITVTGEPLIDLLSPLWPGGSGTSITLESKNGESTDNLLTNGTFEENDEQSIHLPLGWLAPTATLGTTLKMSSVEIQTITVTGTPSAGYYIINWTNAAGKAQSTVPLAYNAEGADVQDALQALVGLEDVTVETTGSTPNFTHTITMTGVTNPAQFTVTNASTGGTYTPGTSTAGSANVLKGARSVEFDADGSQLTTIMVPVTLTALTQYAFNCFLKVDVVPAAGVLTIDLVDGIGGSVIADEEGTNNSFTVTAAGLTTSWVAKSGVFRTPATLPPIIYLRIRQSTAVSSGTSVFLDEAYLGAITEAYADGLCLTAFDGETAWEVDDRAEVAVTNDRAGALHEWLDRIFNLRENRLLFPTVTDGSETQADSLIP